MCCRYFMGDSFKYFRDQGRTETEAWNMCQRNLSTVDTIEGFWQVFNYIERPSRINLGCDYCVFKASDRQRYFACFYFSISQFYRKELSRIGRTSKTSMEVVG